MIGDEMERPAPMPQDDASGNVIVLIWVLLPILFLLGALK